MNKKISLLLKVNKKKTIASGIGISNAYFTQLISGKYDFSEKIEANIEAYANKELKKLFAEIEQALEIETPEVLTFKTLKDNLALTKFLLCARKPEHILDICRKAGRIPQPMIELAAEAYTSLNPCTNLVQGEKFFVKYKGKMYFCCIEVHEYQYKLCTCKGINIATDYKNEFQIL